MKNYSLTCNLLLLTIFHFKIRNIRSTSSDDVIQGGTNTAKHEETKETRFGSHIVSTTVINKFLANPAKRVTTLFAERRRNTQSSLF